MYILLVIIHLLSGQIEVHHSVVKGPSAYRACLEYLPLTENLYRRKAFLDGPPMDQIKNVEGRCIRI